MQKIFFGNDKKNSLEIFLIKLFFFSEIALAIFLHSLSILRLILAEIFLALELDGMHEEEIDAPQ